MGVEDELHSERSVDDIVADDYNLFDILCDEKKLKSDNHQNQNQKENLEEV